MPSSRRRPASSPAAERAGRANGPWRRTACIASPCASNTTPACSRRGRAGTSGRRRRLPGAPTAAAGTPRGRHGADQLRRQAERGRQRRSPGLHRATSARRRAAKVPNTTSKPAHCGQAAVVVAQARQPGHREQGETDPDDDHGPAPPAPPPGVCGLLPTSGCRLPSSGICSTSGGYQRLPSVRTGRNQPEIGVLAGPRSAPAHPFQVQVHGEARVADDGHRSPADAADDDHRLFRAIVRDCLGRGSFGSSRCRSRPARRRGTARRPE